MPAKIFSLDSSKKFEDQEKIGHNRWHPDIPPVATVTPGVPSGSTAGNGLTARSLTTTPRRRP